MLLGILASMAGAVVLIVKVFVLSLLETGLNAPLQVSAPAGPSAPAISRADEGPLTEDYTISRRRPHERGDGEATRVDPPPIPDTSQPSPFAAAQIKPPSSVASSPALAPLMSDSASPQKSTPAGNNSWGPYRLVLPRDGVNVRKGAGISHPVIDALPHRALVQVMAEDTGTEWLRVRYERNDMLQSGFVNGKFVVPNDATGWVTRITNQRRDESANCGWGFDEPVYPKSSQLLLAKGQRTWVGLIFDSPNSGRYIDYSSRGKSWAFQIGDFALSDRSQLQTLGNPMVLELSESVPTLDGRVLLYSTKDHFVLSTHRAIHVISKDGERHAYRLIDDLIPIRTDERYKIELTLSIEDRGITRVYLARYPVRYSGRRIMQIGVPTVGRLDLQDNGTSLSLELNLSAPDVLRLKYILEKFASAYPGWSIDYMSADVLDSAELAGGILAGNGEDQVARIIWVSKKVDDFASFGFTALDTGTGIGSGGRYYWLPTITQSPHGKSLRFTFCDVFDKREDQRSLIHIEVASGR